MSMQKKLRKHFFKFFSFLIASIIWVYVILSQKSVFEKVVKIEYELPDGMTFSEKQVDEAIIYIEGPKAFSKTIQKTDFKVKINLKNESQIKKNIYALNLPVHKIHLPFGMEIQRTVPTKIYLQIEKMMYKNLPIKMSFSGQLPQGLSLESVQLNPKEIDLFGPKSILQKMTHLNLRPVDLEQVYSDEEVPAEIIGLDERITPSLGEVKVAIKVSGLKSNYQVSQKEIIFKNQGNLRFKSPVKFAKIKLFHLDEQQRKIPLKSDQVIVWAEIPRTTKKGEIEVPLRVDYPHSYRLIETIPKSIIINIE